MSIRDVERPVEVKARYEVGNAWDKWSRRVDVQLHDIVDGVQ